MPPPLPPGTAVAAGPQLQAPPPSAHVNPPTGPATQPSVRPALPPEFANLPPGIAASLAKLAGKQPPKTGTG
jgi:hypothetical protein